MRWWRFFIIGLWAVTLASAAPDIVRSVQAGAVVTVPLGQLWYETSPDTLNLIQAGVQRRVSPDLWDSAIVPLLQYPAWWLLTILAIEIMILRGLILLVQWGWRRWRPRRAAQHPADAG